MISKKNRVQLVDQPTTKTRMIVSIQVIPTPNKFGMDVCLGGWLARMLVHVDIVIVGAMVTLVDVHVNVVPFITRRLCQVWRLGFLRNGWLVVVLRRCKAAT